MSEYRIVFEREGKTVVVAEGVTLLQAAIDAGLEPNAPCGGAGKCKKCKMKVAGEVVLSCQTKVDRDMVVDTMPDENKEKAQLLQEGLLRPVDLATGVLPQADHPMLAAIDLGSTSIVLYLHDAFTGEQLGVQSTLNPQRQYGGDVVQRANTAMEQGVEVLSSCVRIAINALLAELSKKVGRTPQDIVRLVIVGNACMHHLFLEYPTNTLVLAPYMPVTKDPVTVKASDVGFEVHPEAELHWLSLIGGFVGADTVGCILAADMDKLDKLTLMVDIGTNGEMVLGNKNFMTATSTAAGPAFEGAKITCGMRGGDGAIDHTWIENGKLAYHVSWRRSIPPAAWRRPITSPIKSLSTRRTYASCSWPKPPSPRASFCCAAMKATRSATLNSCCWQALSATILIPTAPVPSDSCPRSWRTASFRWATPPAPARRSPFSIAARNSVRRRWQKR